MKYGLIVVLLVLFVNGIIISQISSTNGQILVPGIHGSSFVKNVKFTWVLLSNDTEISINLRYLGNGSSPPVLVTASALLNNSNNSIGFSNTIAGSKIFSSGWPSPNTASIKINGNSSLFDAFLVNVVASPYTGCDPSYPDFCIPSPPPLLNCDQISQKNFTVLPPDPHRFDSDQDGRGCELG